MSGNNSNAGDVIARQTRLVENALDMNRGWKDKYKHLMLNLESAQPKVAGVARATVIAMHNQLQYMESIKGKGLAEATFSQNLGALVPKVIDLVRIFYPNLVSQYLFDIQPLDRQNGEVFTIKPQYSNTAAGVVAGQQVFMNPTDGTYASEDVALALGTGDGSTTSYSGAFATLPVRPGTAVIRVAGTAQVALDDGKGNLVGVGITGTINYQTGAVNVTYGTAPVSGAAITGVGRYDSEQAPDNIRGLEIQLNTIPVQAKPHPLRVRWSELASLAASAHLDLDIPDVMANLAASFIKQERDVYGINHILANATPDVNLNFDATPQPGYSKLAKYAEIGLKLNYAESLIQRTMGRGGISWILAGTNAADLLRNANDFVPEPVVAPIGPHLIGTLRDGTVQVIKNPFMDADTYVVGFKGYVLGDAPTILAEWIPLYASPVFQAPDLNNYQGLMSLYALVDNNVKYYVKGVISNYAA